MLAGVCAICCILYCFFCFNVSFTRSSTSAGEERAIFLQLITHNFVFSVRRRGLRYFIVAIPGPSIYLNNGHLNQLEKVP